ncbi:MULTISPECIES: hypothetical protein [unclassified Paraflavitalea]|uniref:hypothetical protein n=1 Tax=unclassified Paraflavitalea TaxID=2798305 RepID=UPI003D32A759
MIVIERVVSVAKAGRVYAEAGTVVKLIADHGNVLIVEDGNGQRFPVARSKIDTEEKPESFSLPISNPIPEEKPAPVLPKTVLPKKATPRKKPSGDAPTLF